MKETQNRTKKFALGENKRCPKKERLAAFFLAETSRVEKFKLIDHIAGCPRCRAGFAVLKEIWAKADSLFDPETEAILEKAKPSQAVSLAQKELKSTAQKKRSRRLGNISPLKTGILATASIAAVLVIYFGVLDRHHPAALERDLEPDTFQVIEPWNGVNVTEIIFRWTPVSESKSYTLEILDSALEVIYREENIFSASFEVPSDFSRRLSKAKTYFWKVTAMLEGGKTVESEFGKFRITENSE